MSTDLDLGLRHDDERTRRRRGRLTRMGRFVVISVVLLSLVAVAGAGVLGVRALTRKLTPKDYAGAGRGSVVVQVRPGDTAADIAGTLAAKGVVRSASAFRKAAADDDRSRSIQPGFYRLHEHMAASAALGLLLDPAARVSSRVTVPEGSALPKVLALLAHDGHIPLRDLQAAARHPAALRPPAVCRGQLEGCLFPATYSFPPRITAPEALKAMLQRFEQASAQVRLDAGARALHRTSYQVLTVASLLEKEAALPADFPRVARVIYNRLDKGMPLQLDSTVVYVLPHPRGHLSTQDTKVRSPYNTYLHPGLPPTPIDSPGVQALQAALHPAAGNWLYFVTVDKQGHTAFTNSYDEFLKLKAKGAAATR